MYAFDIALETIILIRYIENASSYSSINVTKNKKKQLVPEEVNEYDFEENSGLSIPNLIDANPIRDNLGPQSDCKGCMEKMNNEIETIRRFD